LERSSGERFSGLLVSVMPSFLRRFIMTGAKLRAPPLPAGHNLLKSAVSLCSHWKLSECVLSALCTLEPCLAQLCIQPFAAGLHLVVKVCEETTVCVLLSIAQIHPRWGPFSMGYPRWGWLFLWDTIGESRMIVSTIHKGG